MFEKILICHDLSPSSQEALQWALRIGEKFHSELQVVHALARSDMQPNSIENLEEIRHRIRQEIDQDVRGIASKNPSGELKSLKIDVVLGKPIPSLLRTIGQESPDLVLLGSHGRTGFSRVFLGSVAEKIVRHSPSPVLVVKIPAPWPPKVLLLPIDHFESPEETLLLASQLRRVLPVQIEALHVFWMSDVTRMQSGEMTNAMLLDCSAMEKHFLDKLEKSTKAHPSLEAKCHVSTGPITAEICRWAEELHADMILIPTHGRSGMEHLWIGSVAEQVIRYAPCSVLSFCPNKSIPYRKKVVEALGKESQDW